MAVGGLTPSLGTFRTIRASTDLPLVVMLRPRPSGFAYSQSEFTAMLEDMAAFVDEGADSFVVGVLRPDATIDEERVHAFVQTASGKDVAFHRAFDATPDPIRALETLVQLGVKRVLTSGHATTALQGVEMLKTLVTQSKSRIDILAGGGVRPDNVREIVARSGVKQVHLGPFSQKLDQSIASSEASASIYGATYPIPDALAISRVVVALRLG